ncbi:MAG: hypothetical protein ABSD50_02590 [Smithella sp.]|jgi:hypothetical protein
MKIYKITCCYIFISLLFAFFWAASAWANLAANTQIINNATLSYNDGTGTKTATASVSVTVVLVPSAPNIVAGTAQTTSYSGTATLTDSYTVTGTANGPDTYNITAAVSGSTNTNTGTPGASPTAATVSLGGTVTTAGSSATVINVPSDGVANNNLNGIVVGSTVVINGDVRTVLAISDNASGTSTITLNQGLSGGAPGAGVLVAEQKVITTTVTPGTITSSGTDVTVSDKVTIASATNPSVTATSPLAVLNTFTSGVATLTKYVRNVSTASGTGTPYVYNSTNYYSAGVTAKPGDVLEYVLVATNSSATGSVSASVVTDSLPTSYVAFTKGAYPGSTDVTYVSDSGATSYLTANGTGAANYSAPTLTVYIGTGATSSAGGTIPANKSELVLYRVTLNN